MEQIISIIITAMAVSTISLTVSKSKIFESTRTFITNKSYWFGELVSCFYCFSHWVAACVVAATDLKTNYGFIITTLAIINIAAIFTGIILKLTSASATVQYNNDGE